jgi:micrococcal nuclease
VALRRPAGLVLLLVGLLATTSTAAGSLDGAVVRVVDGDTIYVRLADRVEKIRYIGVDAPEIHHPIKGEEPGGREAAEVNRRLVGGARCSPSRGWGPAGRGAPLLCGRHVRLELDVRTRDRYGRLLAYVWAGDTMVNAELVRLGYAQVMTVPPNVKYQRLFLELQREARESHRGLWQAAEKTTPRS